MLHWVCGIVLCICSIATGKLLASGDSEEPSVSQIPNDKTSDANARTEKLQVTGSRVTRTDNTGISPVLIINQSEIFKSGAGSVSELLQMQTVSINGSYGSPTVNDSRGTVTNANIRGLGPDRTLILLDGQRLPDEGGLSIVDLSTIPLSFVDRVEILRDSASAIYGSDAVGGVINIITKKSFQGNEISVRSTKPLQTGGDKKSVAAVAGVTGTSYSLLNVLHYQHTSATRFSDRNWTKNVLSSYSIPANIGLTTFVKNPETGAVELDENGQPKTQTAFYGPDNCPTKNTNRTCAYNIGKISQFSPEASQLGLLSRFNKTIDDRLSMFATIRLQENKSNWNMAENAGSFVIPAATLAKNPSLNISGQELDPSKDATVRYRAVMWGPKVWEEKNQIIGSSVGLDGVTKDNIEWKITASRTETNKLSENPSGFFLANIVKGKIADGSLNPFETNQNDPILATIRQESKYKPYVRNKTMLISYDGQASTEVFQLPGGKAYAAIGLNRTEQDYEKVIDNQSEVGNVSNVSSDKSGSGTRTINAAYAEFVFPITRDIELQLNARHDQYSDFGSTTNPQIGAKYRILPSLAIYGSLGKGFRAPSLDQIYNRGSATVVNLTDTPRKQSGLQTEIEVETYGSDTLKEEKSLNGTIGLTIEPMSGMTLNADYWYVKINGIIRPIDAQKALDAIAEGSNVPGVEIFRVNNSPDGQLVKMRVPTSNLGTSEDAGCNLRTDYHFKTSVGAMNISSEYSRMFYSKTVGFPGAEQVDVLGERGHPWWRMLNLASWTTHNHTLSIQNNIISKQKQRQSTDGGIIGSYSTIDAHYLWNHPWNGKLSIGLLNIANKMFPLDQSERPGDDQRVKELYSADGRTLVLGIDQSI